MTDLAIFRAPESVSGTVVSRHFSEANLPVVRVRLTAPLESVYAARLNGILCPGIEHVSPAEVLLDVPEALWGDAPSSYRIEISGSRNLLDPTGSTSALPAHYGLGRSPSRIEGVSEAVQATCRELFMTPGTDRRFPQRGGGLLQALRSVKLARVDLHSVISPCVERTNAGLRRPSVAPWRVQSVLFLGAKAYPSAAAAGYGTSIGADGMVAKISLRFHVKGPQGPLQVVGSSVEI